MPLAVSLSQAFLRSDQENNNALPAISILLSGIDPSPVAPKRPLPPKIKA
jgi:hypothetical protein